MDMRAQLPKSMLPDRDLWPQIAAEIRRGEHSRANQVSFAKLRHAVHFARTSRWILRLALAAILGLMLILGAIYLSHRTSAPAPKPGLDSKHPLEIKRAMRASKVVANQKMGQVNQLSQAPESQVRDDKRLANFALACQCEPSPEITSLINKAWVTNKNITHLQRRKIFADALYQLACENAENFFLHKASLEAIAFPSGIIMAPEVIDRYGARLELYPNDPAAIYLFGYTLFGKDTPRMIQLMQQLVSDYPEFPWPYLALAKAYREVFYRNNNRATFYLQSFMNLCPKNPDPIPLLGGLEDPDFLAETVSRMRSNLAARTDIPSLLLYDRLWQLESAGAPTRQEMTRVQEKIKDDLNRLRSLGAADQPEVAELIRLGYRMIGAKETAFGLAQKDPSYMGRWDLVRMEIKDWNEKNPVPPHNAAAAKRMAYWEKRLKASDSWINRVPENPSLWILKLEALAELKNRPQAEFIEAARKSLALERVSEEPSQFSPEGIFWGSNILRLAMLCVERGVWLDQIPTLIEEGLEAAEKYSWKMASDLAGDLQWSFLRGRFSSWLKADEAWHSLAEAYLQLGRRDKADEILDYIEQGLTEFKSQLAKRQMGNKVNDLWLFTTQQQWMRDELAAREKRYIAARDRLTHPCKKTGVRP